MGSDTRQTLGMRGMVVNNRADSLLLVEMADA